MMAQIIARNVFNSMTWPEEFSRYCYIWTVFLSLGYTMKKGNMLKVGLVMDLLPTKIRRSIEIVVNLIILAICVVFFRHAITYTGKIYNMGQISPAMHLTMWIMYLATVLGFGLASIRTVQQIVHNIKNFNVKAETTLEALSLIHIYSSLGGFGGCPFVPGAAGNVSTEDVVHMMDEMGIKTGIDILKLIELSRNLQDMLGNEGDSYILKAGRTKDLFK